MKDQYEEIPLRNIPQTPGQPEHELWPNLDEMIAAAQSAEKQKREQNTTGEKTQK